MKSELISVIVPVYNAQDYIARCLDSILSQTYSNLEILCIIDGATDSSESICQEYASKDSRVKVHSIANRGVSRARNYGLEQMHGDWFAYVDSDDWLEKDFYEILIDNAHKYNCDISGCRFERNSEYIIDTKRNDEQLLQLHSPKECIHNFICPGLSLEGMVWNKIYRSELFASTNFDCHLKVNEDCMYTYNLMEKCSKACISSLQLYHWFYRDDSACHSKPKTADFSPAIVFSQLYDQTQVLNDTEISIILKKNYIQSVVNILLNAKYNKNDVAVKQAKAKCKLWCADVWSQWNIKMKIKYLIAMF